VRGETAVASDPPRRAGEWREKDEERGGRPLRPRGVSGWRTGGGSSPEARASRARRRALSSAEVMRALAVEPAEKMGGGARAFEGIAFEAGGDQVAIGVAPGADAGHDVVRDTGRGRRCRRRQ